LGRIEIPIWPGMTTEHLMCGALIRRSVISASAKNVRRDEIHIAFAILKSDHDRAKVSRRFKETHSFER
jgi:hypothetical protein